MQGEFLAQLENDSGWIKLYREPNKRNFSYYGVAEGFLSELTGQTKLTTKKVARFPELIKLLKLHYKEWNTLKLVSCTKFEKDIQNSLIGEKTHYNSQQRTLDLFYHLQKEKAIHVQQAMIDYGVHKETIKSDIYLMREVLENDFTTIEAKDHEGRYEISASDQFSVGDAFALLLLIYHNQSLNVKEVKNLQNKIINQFSSIEQQKLRSFFQSYEYYYHEFISRDLLPDIEKIFQAIQQHQLVTFTYKKYDGSSRVRLVKPLTIILHDKAYYLVGHEVGREQEYPSNFGLDRIFDLNTTDQTVVPDKRQERFQPGQYANQSFNMFTGKVETVTLKIQTGIKPYFLRRFPSGVIVQEDESSFVAKVEVAGTEGILFWILSQKTDVEVLQPINLRRQMKQLLTDMLTLYGD
jgi:predicted DNA-binding transcriptional regulator YafY